MDENTELQTPEPSLRDDLAAAFDSGSKEESTSTSEPTTTSTPATTPTKIAEPNAAVTQTDLDAAKTAIAEERPIPERLKAKWGEKWQTIDKDLRAEFHHYESSIGGLASKYGKAAKSWDQAMQVSAPYMDMIRKEGGDYHSATANLFETARILRQGLPEQKVQLVRQMCQAYGIPLETVIGNRQLTPNGEPQAGQVQETSPQLLNRLNELERMMLTRDADVTHNAKQKVNSDVEIFLADTANVYAQEPGYLDTMAGLISAGKADNIKSAYEQAAWLHERTRNLEIAKMNAARMQPRVDAASQARRANVSLNGNAPGSVSRDSSKMNLREALSAAYDGDLQ